MRYFNLYKLAFLLCSLVSVSASYGQVAETSPEPEPEAEPYVDPDESYIDDSGWPVKRRRNQVRTTPGYILAPAAANIPGIGFTYGVLGSYFNINATEADFYAFKFWGDLAGYGLALTNVPLLTQALVGTVVWNEFDQAAIDTHRRGMDSDPDQLTRIQFARFGLLLGQLNLRLFEQRVQLYASVNRQVIRPESFYNKDGDLIGENEDESENARVNRSYGFLFDLTDDRSDPRKGFAFEIFMYDPPRASDSASDFYVMDYNAVGYIPLGRYSTWAFNGYRSDAVVRDAGVTSEDEVEKDLDISCDGLDEADKSACQEEVDQQVNETIARNRHGTASAIGGTQRLRSYVSNRFYAAHSMFFGTEVRWNITDEFTPFNYIIMGGVRTGVQFASFYEIGTVAERPDELWKTHRSSYGVGIRFLIASGFVVRLDAAFGREGMQPTLIFQYPWNLF